jgi:xanthine dehydrogenase YagT iron-sulfur-binding subunit
MERVSRRGFITSAGVGVVGAAALRGAEAETVTAKVLAAGEPVPITLRVNGHAHALSALPRTTLLEALREHIGLAGTKPGCERGECGACTVLVDGQTRYACQMLALEAEGHEVTTIEGLAKGEALSDVQNAFVAEDAMQCGYCIPGQVMAVEGLLRQEQDPSLEQIREGVSGNLCRCGAYAHIFKAAQRAAAARRNGGQQP